VGQVSEDLRRRGRRKKRGVEERRESGEEHVSKGRLSEVRDRAINLREESRTLL
jgi:hypothetical protein